MMKMRWMKQLFVLAFVPTLVHSLGATDEVQDAVRTYSFSAAVIES